jgi:hypothetical protein
MRAVAQKMWRKLAQTFYDETMDEKCGLSPRWLKVRLDT